MMFKSKKAKAPPVTPVEKEPAPVTPFEKEPAPEPLVTTSHDDFYKVRFFDGASPDEIAMALLGVPRGSKLYTSYKPSTNYLMYGKDFTELTFKAPA